MKAQSTTSGLPALAIGVIIVSILFFALLIPEWNKATEQAIKDVPCENGSWMLENRVNPPWPIPNPYDHPALFCQLNNGTKLWKDANGTLVMQ